MQGLNKNIAKFAVLIFLVALLGLIFLTGREKQVTISPLVSSYANLVYKNYHDAYKDALVLKQSVEDFLTDPTEETLADLQKSWLLARASYSQTEVFHLYNVENKEEINRATKEKLNTWPINPAYIDYTKSNNSSGIINQVDLELNKELIVSQNQIAKTQENGSLDVLTGYHVIEFLLWGEDLSLDSAGRRSYQDYIAGDEVNDRRRHYLELTVNLLVSDLKFLVNSWDQSKVNNNVARILQQKEAECLTNILTSLAATSVQDLVDNNLSKLLSGNNQDEQSDFSDNTHMDYIYTLRGIDNVYFAKYRDFIGDVSVHDLVSKQNPELATNIVESLVRIRELMFKLPTPIDKNIMDQNAAPENKELIKEIITLLQKQALLFREAGKLLNIDLKIDLSKVEEALAEQEKSQEVLSSEDNNGDNNQKIEKSKE